LATWGCTPPTQTASAAGSDASAPHVSHALKVRDFDAPGQDAGPHARGRLPKEVIQRVVRAQFDDMRTCYDDALRRDAAASGLVTVRFTIGLDGLVSRPEAIPPPFPSQPSLDDSRAVNCIIAAYKKLVFPPPEGGEVIVVYPINFDPGD
jgi:hypothetical protein